MLVNDIALKDVLFFTIDQTMRRLRLHSARAFAEAGFDVTVDQWLVLKRVSDSNGQVCQSEIAEMLNKDSASLTRIIDLLVKKYLLVRQENAADRRRFDLVLTNNGVETIRQMLPLVQRIRTKALSTVSDAEMLVLRQVLEKIMLNIG